MYVHVMQVLALGGEHRVQLAWEDYELYSWPGMCACIHASACQCHTNTHTSIMLQNGYGPWMLMLMTMDVDNASFFFCTLKLVDAAIQGPRGARAEVCLCCLV